TWLSRHPSAYIDRLPLDILTLSFPAFSSSKVSRARPSAAPHGITWAKCVEGGKGILRKMALFRRGGDRSEAHPHARAAPFLQVGQRFGALHSAKAATEDDRAFGVHSWRGKQLTGTGKFSYHREPAG